MVGSWTTVGELGQINMIGRRRGLGDSIIHVSLDHDVQPDEDLRPKCAGGGLPSAVKNRRTKKSMVHKAYPGDVLRWK